jgi:hypothetical protein
MKKLLILFIIILPFALHAQTVTEQILGTDSYQAFITQYFFAMVGATISLLLHGANRDVKEPSTPNCFSFSFLLKDNWKRILLNLLVIFVTIRFFKEITGYKLSLFFCLAIGIGYDKLLQFMKDKADFLQVTRKP